MITRGRKHFKGKEGGGFQIYDFGFMIDGDFEITLFR